MSRVPKQELAEYDTKELVDRIAQREELALSMLIEVYGPRVLGLCRSIVGEQLEAESVMSDVFLELWNRPQSYDAERASIATYLLTLARSRSIDRLRRRSSQTVQMEKIMSNETQSTRHDHSETSEAAALLLEKRQQVQCALLRLPKQQRDALQLAFFSGLTHREVSARLQLPLGTIKSHIRKGLMQLKSELADTLELG